MRPSIHTGRRFSRNAASPSCASRSASAHRDRAVRLRSGRRAALEADNTARFASRSTGALCRQHAFTYASTPARSRRGKRPRHQAERRASSARTCGRSGSGRAPLPAHQPRQQHGAAGGNTPSRISGWPTTANRRGRARCRTRAPARGRRPAPRRSGRHHRQLEGRAESRSHARTLSSWRDARRCMVGHVDTGAERAVAFTGQQQDLRRAPVRDGLRSAPPALPAWRGQHVQRRPRQRDPGDRLDRIEPHQLAVVLMRQRLRRGAAASAAAAAGSDAATRRTRRRS
jgi:hypothetical protein